MAKGMLRTAAEFRVLIEELIPKAESGSDWAEIAYFEELMIEAEREEREANRNFAFSGSF